MNTESYCNYSDSVQEWYIENYMKSNLPKTNIIYFLRKRTVSISIDILVTFQSYVQIVYRNLLDTKLYFHRNVDYIHRHALNWLGIIRFIPHDYASFDSPIAVYIALLRICLYRLQ
jgi:hypothetical protein